MFLNEETKVYLKITPFYIKQLSGICKIYLTNHVPWCKYLIDEFSFTRRKLWTIEKKKGQCSSYHFVK